ncbi:MAG: hypothetical protein IPK17_28980 [Chloroflexi bacterium]|uniref:choice-of-anchor R domain-containing protein n=1 Tax=Candidatus Flexifilum breve TaxID=3140694 RepID=UPI003135044C|nr:hypothetical protein [Chloroflexota bacterium]
MRLKSTEFIVVLLSALLISFSVVSPLPASAAASQIVLNNAPVAGFAAGYSANFFDVGITFSVPVGTNYTLNSFSVQLVGSGATYQAFLYEYSGTRPGTLVSQIGGPVTVNAGGAGALTPFIPTTPLTLRANSAYTVVLMGTGGSYGLTASVPTGVFTFLSGALYDKTGSTWYSLGTLSLAVTIEATPILPAALVPRCDTHNFDVDGIVRASLADALGYAINCRVLYQNGSPVEVGEASLGLSGLTEYGIRQAIDIFSPPGMTYFEGGGVFCLRDAGTLIWLAASQAPRHAEIIGSYTVPEFPGFTCATLFEPGTLILVERSP